MMPRKLFERATLVACIVVIATLLAGCDPPDVEIVIGEGYRGATIQVDFIKVPAGQLDQWLKKDIDDYFSPNDPDRKQALESGSVHSVYLNVPGRKFMGQIPSKHSIWEKYEFDRSGSDQAFDILVLADLPNRSSSTTVEPRRKVIPLYKKAWPTNLWENIKRALGGGLKDLTISITREGIILDPAPESGVRR